jgi:flagellar biosynthesis/type III secretory pathway protein FliH
MTRAARILSPAEAANATPVAATVLDTSRRNSLLERVVPAPLIAAQQQAKALLEQAEARATEEYDRRLNELLSLEQERSERFERACEQRQIEWSLREDAERQAALERQQNELSQIAVLLAERILGEQLRLFPATIVSLTHEVLSEARGAKRLCISVSPEDVAELSKAKAAIMERFQASIEVIEDSSLNRGDLLIESELGRTDARLKTRLACLLEMLGQRTTL